MKKAILLVALGACINSAAHAQSSLFNKVKNVASVAGIDVDGVTSSIVGKLVPSLGLTASQKPGVANVISNFLTKKSAILPLMESNPAAYKSKFGSLLGSLKSNLGTILTAAQMTKFLGLKPKVSDATNLLSQLFF